MSFAGKEAGKWQGATKGSGFLFFPPDCDGSSACAATGGMDWGPMGEDELIDPVPSRRLCPCKKTTQLACVPDTGP